MLWTFARSNRLSSISSFSFYKMSRKDNLPTEVFTGFLVSKQSREEMSSKSEARET